MKHIPITILVCLTAALAACSDGGPVIDRPEGGTTLHLIFPPEQAVEHRLPFRISGGLPPYDLSIEGCPDWVTLFPDQGILAGTAPVQDRGKSIFCTYRVTESDPGFRPQQSVSHALRLAVGSGSTGILSLAFSGKLSLTVGTFHGEALPAASGGVGPYTYSFTCAGGQLPSGMSFAPATRMFAGTPDARFRDSCTYTVTDSSQPGMRVSRAVEVEVSGRAVTPLSLPQDFVLTSPPGAVVSLPMERRARVTFAPRNRGCGALHLRNSRVRAPFRTTLQPGLPHSVRLAAGGL